MELKHVLALSVKVYMFEEGQKKCKKFVASNIYTYFNKIVENLQTPYRGGNLSKNLGAHNFEMSF